MRNSERGCHVEYINDIFLCSLFSLTFSALAVLGAVDVPSAEGIVTYDETKLEPGEKVYIALVGRFRYGREEDEILGMSLCREIYMGYMPVCSIKRMLSPQGSMGSNGGPHEKLESLPGPSSGELSQRVGVRVWLHFCVEEGRVHNTEASSTFISCHSRMILVVHIWLSNPHLKLASRTI